MLSLTPYGAERFVVELTQPVARLVLCRIVTANRSKLR
jgi:hypothetical protein